VTRLARRLRDARSPGNLSGRKATVLSDLYRSGPRTAGEIAAADFQQPQSLTRVFAELEAEGLISRRRSEDDRRQSILEVTDKGRELLVGQTAERDAWLASALAELTDTEVRFLRLAAVLLDRIADATPDLTVQTDPATAVR